MNTSPIAKPEDFGVSERDVNSLASKLRQALNTIPSSGSNIETGNRRVGDSGAGLMPAAPRANVR